MKKKQKNNHARSKRKIKLLKLKSFTKRVTGNRLKKIAKLKKPKGKTIMGKASLAAFNATSDMAVYISVRPRHLNQRQQRKIWRQAPHMRKRA